MPNVIVKLHYYPSHASDNKYSKRRDFYSSGKTDDYMRYIDNGGKAGSINYVDYVGNEEKSFGVFGRDGLLTKEQKKDIRQKLKTTKSVIWDMVISFKEDYGMRHMKDFDEAKDLLCSQLNRFFKRAGLNPTNITWYAGLHSNTDNRHIHISFFENEPLRTRQLDYSKMCYHNGNVSQHAIDGFKVAIEQHFSDISTKAKQTRKDLLRVADSVLDGKFGNALNTENSPKLQAMFAQLYLSLPTEGRLGYDSDNMKSVKSKVDEITTYMLQNNSFVKQVYGEFRNALLDKDDEMRTICKKQKIGNVEDYLIADRTVQDFYRRLGNKEIRRTLELKKERKTAERTIKRKRYENKKLGFLISESARLNVLFEEESVKAFQEFLDKLEQAEYKILPEEYAM